jgi:hypothetical protein
MHTSARCAFTIVMLASCTAVLIDYCYRMIKYGPIPRVHWGGVDGGTGNPGGGAGDDACGDSGGGCGHLTTTARAKPARCSMTASACSG